MAAATSPSVLARSCTQLRPRPRPRLRPPPRPRCLRSRARCITAPGVDEEPVHAPEIFESRPGERFLFQAGETLRIEELPEGTRVVVSGRRRERSPLSRCPQTGDEIATLDTYACSDLRSPPPLSSPARAPACRGDPVVCVKYGGVRAHGMRDPDVQRRMIAHAVDTPEGTQPPFRRKVRDLVARCKDEGREPKVGGVGWGGAESRGKGRTRATWRGAGQEGAWCQRPPEDLEDHFGCALLFFFAAPGSATSNKVCCILQCGSLGFSLQRF